MTPLNWDLFLPSFIPLVNPHVMNGGKTMFSASIGEHKKNDVNTAQSIKNDINDSIPLLMIMEKVHYHN